MLLHRLFLYNSFAVEGTMSNGKVLCLLVTAMVLAADVAAIPFSQFYPFGEETGDSLLIRGGSPSSNVTLPLQLFYFGQPFNNIFVSFKCMQIVTLVNNTIINITRHLGEGSLGF